MLNITQSASAKREAFRQELASGRLLQLPGAFSPLGARQIEQFGFDGVYISGAVLAAELGLPDIGLTTLTEVTQRGYQINRATNLPTLIDVDTGFGEPMNMARTIFELENLGLSGCHLEDQVNPKRCGHLDGKQLVNTQTMVRRVRAAVDTRRDSNFLIMARTDARASEGLESAINRAKAYLDAGADAIFPEALADEREFEAFRKAIDAPLLANMTEFGKSRLMSREELANLGVNLVIYPVSALRSAMGASHRLLQTIRKEGSQLSVVDQMQTRAELYELLDYADYNRLDQSLFNFRVADSAQPEQDRSGGREG
ncbi:MAG: methylisocitrate lyase [Porticoccus sp.]|nr:MAG: methylisocitrate lyase [Porticoccus sp.]